MMKILRSGYLIGFGCIALLWIWRASSLFTFQGAFPLHAENFEEILPLLGGYRLVLPEVFLYLFPTFIALLPLILLFFIYSLFARLLLAHLPYRISLGMLFTSFLLPLADPGSGLKELSAFLYGLICLSAVFPPQVGRIQLWTLINLSGLIALLIPSQRALFAWLILSLIAGELVQKLVLQRAKPERLERQRPLLEVNLAIALSLCLLSWLWVIEPEFGSQIPTFWWLSFIVGGLLLVLSWKNVWDTKRWVGIASFSMGGLLIDQILYANLALLGLLILELIRNFAQVKIPEKLELGLKTLVAAIALVFGFILSASYENTRTFNVEWAKLTQRIRNHENGLALVGKAVGYISFFYPGTVIENPDLLLESSESQFLKWMQTHQIDAWVVERSFLREYWRSLIQDGRNPDDINKSILSRLSLYEGKAVETKTIQLEEVNSFELLAEADSDFILIKRKLQ